MYKTGAKPLRLRFEKINRSIKIHDKIRYFVLFDYSYCDEICDKIKHLISEKVVLQVALIITFQESELILIIRYLLKKY